jgi:L-fuconolactonase
MTTRIDSHHHLWRFDPREYGWIGEEELPLRRDFGLPELEAATASAGIGGTIAVQARQSLEETRWLLSLAAEGGPIRGVTGWLPLASPAIGDLLAEFSGNRLLKGLRHVVQDEPDDAFILGRDFNRGVSLLRDRGLVYEILVYQRQLQAVERFLGLHPDQPLVLDHLGKPAVRQGGFAEWAPLIRRLARFPNLSCKLSGLVTESDPANWTPDELSPYIDAALEAFGPERLMFGSDWPVCLRGASYQEWTATVETLTARLSAAERARIMGGTAIKVYGLDPAP